MSEFGGWNVEGASDLAAEFRALARRTAYAKISTNDMVMLSEKIVQLMHEANAAAEEIAALKAELEKAGKPKFAPFAPSRHARMQ